MPRFVISDLIPWPICNFKVVHFTDQVICKLQHAFQLTQVLSLGLVKISVLLFYRRIFCSKSSTTLFNVVSQIWIVVVLMWTVAFFFALIFSCGLRSWVRWPSSGALFKDCTNTIFLEEGFVASDFGTDMVTLLMPLPMVGTDVFLRQQLTWSADLDTPHEHQSQDSCHGSLLVGRSVSN